MGHLVVGLAFLAAGIAVTVMSEAVVWYGAIIVGAIEVGRGVYTLARSPGPAAGSDD